MSNPICSFPACGKSVHTIASGLCCGHYAQRKLGKPLTPIARTPAERFWAKVQKSPDCWLWVGAKNHLGYGQIWDGKRVDMAHRVSLRMAGGPLGADQDVDHLCRTPSCVRPDHLEAVTHAVNMARAPWTAIQFQASKTHCKRGHEFTLENTRTKPNPSGGLSRVCRACKRWHEANARARRAANAPVT